MPLDEETDVPLIRTLPDERLLEVHEVLDHLEAEDEMTARIVRMRVFGGMKNPEIAALLDVSKRTVGRHWSVAKVWLVRALDNKN